MELIKIDAQVLSLEFPKEQYYPIATKKKQICIHHTASGAGIEGDVNWWKSTPDHVATPFIIARDGTVWQLFDPIYWAHHLGLKTANNTTLNKGRIGIELDSWGWLKGGKSYTGAKVTAITKYTTPFKGHSEYESYTTNQLASLAALLRYLCAAFDIPTGYRGDGMFSLNQDALNGVPGIWTHVSYRSDKFDCHPQPELIKVLKEI